MNPDKKKQKQAIIDLYEMSKKDMCHTCYLMDCECIDPKRCKP